MLLLPVLAAGDPAQPPKDDSVVAGPVAFAIFVVLILVIAFLGWSLVRQFRKMQAAADRGVYDTEPADQHATAAASTASSTAPAEDASQR